MCGPCKPGSCHATLSKLYDCHIPTQNCQLSYISTQAGACIFLKHYGSVRTHDVRSFVRAYNHGSLKNHDVRERLVESKIPWFSTHPRRTRTVRSFTNTMGVQRPTTHENSSFIHKHHGSPHSHDVLEQFVHSQNTMGVQRPTTYVGSSFIHKTPWVSRDPRRTRAVRSFTKHRGFPEAHEVRKLFVHSQNTMGFQRPTTYEDSSFIHNTPWFPTHPRHTRTVRSVTKPCVSRDRRRTRTNRSFTKHHGFSETHDVREQAVHSQNTVVPHTPTTYKNRWSFIHKTPWVFRGPRRKRTVCSFTKHHGSLQTHDVQRQYVHSQNTMGFQRPTTYENSSFFQKTPWVFRDPRRTRTSCSFTKHQWFLETRDVRGQFVHSQNTMGFQGPTTYETLSFKVTYGGGWHRYLLREDMAMNMKTSVRSRLSKVLHISQQMS